MTADSTQRFSDRVEAYLAGRPRYPAELVTHLETIGALQRTGIVADIGVGTGLSAEPFLAAGHRVVGVEPNAPMRAAGVEFLARYPAYTARDGTAEATGLEAGTIDLVIAGQAFHWFDPPRFRAESLRILRPGGWAALIWNDRDLDGTRFLAGYEALLVEYGNDYRAIRYKHQGTDSIPVYFGGHAPAPAEFQHRRPMDWGMLTALAGSASYLPAPGQPRNNELMAALRALFDACAAGGTIEMRYTCRVHAAPLG
ncbi:MAG TPA: class I SAM-dependent methyltransferase [Burkholderiaceae bacterium]|nr:class I SAM-dependent methyltransferase [Burkholderiaceae bacterium]HQR69687.1 class I SAM-dependent methyltransferase [Burkholderiaceae bacterium]